MASLDVGECKCDKGVISVSALHKNWGVGEDGSQNVAGLSIGGEMIILSSYQVKDLIDKLQTANQWVREHYLDSWSYDELKEAKVLFNPPLEWEQDEKEAIRQRILAEEKAKREKLANPENRRCASCVHYSQPNELCEKRLQANQEELNALLRDVVHLKETRDRRIELSHVVRSKPDDTCENWEMKRK